MTIHNPHDLVFIDPAGRERKLKCVQTVNDRWSRILFEDLNKDPHYGYLNESVLWCEKTGDLSDKAYARGWSQREKESSMTRMTNQQLHEARAKYIYRREAGVGRPVRHYELYSVVTSFGTQYSRCRLFCIEEPLHIEDIDIKPDGQPAKHARIEGFMAITRAGYEEEIGDNMTALKRYLDAGYRAGRAPAKNAECMTLKEWMIAANMWGKDESHSYLEIDDDVLRHWWDGVDPAEIRANVCTLSPTCPAQHKNVTTTGPVPAAHSTSVTPDALLQAIPLDREYVHRLSCPRCKTEEGIKFEVPVILSAEIVRVEGGIIHVKREEELKKTSEEPVSSFVCPNGHRWVPPESIKKAMKVLGR